MALQLRITAVECIRDALACGCMIPAACDADNPSIYFRNTFEPLEAQEPAKITVRTGHQHGADVGASRFQCVCVLERLRIEELMQLQVAGANLERATAVNGRDGWPLA